MPPAGAGRRRRTRGLHSHGDGRRQLARSWSRAVRSAYCEPARSNRSMPRPRHDRYAQPRAVGAVGAVESRAHRGERDGLNSIPPAIGGGRARRGGGWTPAVPNARAGWRARHPAQLLRALRQTVPALGLDHLAALAQLRQQRADRPGGDAGGYDAARACSISRREMTLRARISSAPSKIDSTRASTK